MVAALLQRLVAAGFLVRLRRRCGAEAGVGSAARAQVPSANAAPSNPHIAFVIALSNLLPEIVDDRTADLLLQSPHAFLLLAPQRLDLRLLEQHFVLRSDSFTLRLLGGFLRAFARSSARLACDSFSSLRRARSSSSHSSS